MDTDEGGTMLQEMEQLIPKPTNKHDIVIGAFASVALSLLAISTTTTLELQHTIQIRESQQRVLGQLVEGIHEVNEAVQDLIGALKVEDGDSD
jgi:hypothetical protein